MCFTFKKHNKQTNKPINRFLQDDASAGIQSLQTSIEIKLSKVQGTDFSSVSKARSPYSCNGRKVYWNGALLFQ